MKFLYKENMTPEEFDVLLERRLKNIRFKLGAKAKEYAQGLNRLHNFERGAEIRGCTPAQALMGMMLKHEVSVHDLVDFPVSSEIDTDSYNALVEEKVGDHINYLILLEALLKEGFSTLNPQ